jgi:hypothetical protein
MRKELSRQIYVFDLNLPPHHLIHWTLRRMPLDQFFPQVDKMWSVQITWHQSIHLIVSNKKAKATKSFIFEIMFTTTR